VSTDGEGVKAVDYPKLAVPMLNLLQDQEKRISDLEKRLERLEK